MADDNILIRLRSIRISYRVRNGPLRWSKHTPLNDVSFDLHRGETVGIVGRNGVGKSTLLKLIAGILEPDGGEIQNFGARVTLLSLGVGFVPHLTGRENAILSGMLLGLRKREITNKINAITEFSGLGEFIDKPLQTYSSGMRARLGFSVAIQMDPDILLIDEILGVGDEEFRKKSTAEMKRLINSEKTVVLVSHNLTTLRELCDRLVWLENGCVKEVNATEDVLARYASDQISRH